ncbi:hypothetical protein IW152_003312 [Coemansia sp. BCRC 34962]|nr:hypothetical protein IW152_003312 [Coemansia sp. BCRC 34962]
MGALDWGHVRMVSVELDGFYGYPEAAGGVVEFVHGRLSGVSELWVALSDDMETVRSMVEGARYPNVEELRIVGKASSSSLTEHVSRVVVPEYGGLTAISLDGASVAMTSVAELVGRSRAALRELNIEEYSVAMAALLGLHPDSKWMEYPRLRQLAISSEEASEYKAVIDGRRLPAVEMLYYREASYPLPSGSGYSPIFDSPCARLMQGEWRGLRLLVVDALSRGDIEAVGRKAPRLEVLRVGMLSSDIDFGDLLPPAPALDLGSVSLLLATCGRLVELCVETPEAFEDYYNNHEGADPRLPWYERPFDVQARVSGGEDNSSGLRSLMLNAWALTFDQMLVLFESLGQLVSFEGNLKFNASCPATRRLQSPPGHPSLAHLSLVLSTATRHRRVFKSNLLRFISMLPRLKRRYLG